MNRIDEMMQSLSEGGVTSLTYQTVHDTTTGETSYIDGHGNTVTQDEADAQDAARAALDQIPEVTAEEVMDESNDDRMNEEGNEYMEVESVRGKNDNRSNSEGDEGNEGDGGNESDDSSNNQKKRKLLPSARPNKSNTTPAALNKSKTRPTPSSGHRAKRWSEIKSWKIIMQAEESQECPDDINELVDQAERTAGKPLKGKYLTTVQ